MTEWTLDQVEPGRCERCAAPYPPPCMYAEPRQACAARCEAIVAAEGFAPQQPSDFNEKRPHSRHDRPGDDPRVAAKIMRLIDAGWTQAEVAEEFGVHRATVYRWLRHAREAA
jgi:Homeodomain-like domain